MEFPQKVTRRGQALLAVFLAVLAAVMWAESRSELAATIRSGQPWLCWVGFIDPNGAISERALGIFQPAKRSFDIVDFSPLGPRRQKNVDMMITREPEADHFPEIPGAPPFLKGLYFPTGEAGWRPEEPALMTRDWLLKAAQGLGFWSKWARRLMKAPSFSSDMPFFDQLLFTIELHRLSAEQVRAAWLPLDENDRRTLYARILAPTARASERGATVEILNATGRAGVASSATDVLRSQGVDVVNVGNWTGFKTGRTIIYDRTGRVEDAEAVREKFGCGSAAVVTQMTPKKLVDATVVLADDCASPQERGAKWNWLKF